MRLTNGGLTWVQTANIDQYTGRWNILKELNITGIAYAASFNSNSDSRLKTNIEEIPEKDAIN